MSSIIAPAKAAPAPLDPSRLAGETGMVERPRRRFLPFDPWHLFLAPLAAVMLLPLVWMVVTSLETLAQTRHFPPILWPGTLQFGNYADAIHAVGVRHVVLEHHRRDGHDRPQQPRLLLARRLRVRAGSASSAAASSTSCCWPR